MSNVSLNTGDPLDTAGRCFLHGAISKSAPRLEYLLRQLDIRPLDEALPIIYVTVAKMGARRE